MENSGLAGLCQSIILKALERSAADIRHKARLQLMRAMLMAAAILIGLLALFWGLMALFIYLSGSMPPLMAAGWIAGGLLLLTLFLCLTARLLPRGCRTSPESRAGGQKTTADPAAMMSEIARMITEHPAKAGLAALAAGLVVGYFPEVRSILLKALEADKNREAP